MNFTSIASEKNIGGVCVSTDVAITKGGGLSALAKEISKLTLNPNVESKVNQRVKEFDRIKKSGSEIEWFSELCFCIMTANSTARLGIEIQSALGEGCMSLPDAKVRRILVDYGHRFARPRAEYICKARSLPELRATLGPLDDRSAREWLVENVIGLGYKEASHFLRNTGHYDVAILDRHILRVMFDHGLIDEIPKTLTKRRYLEIEKKLEALADKTGLPLGILDYYMWYMRTGEILK